jgi:23S rRNA pseudouridine955/2504/2580 synthase
MNALAANRLAAKPEASPATATGMRPEVRQVRIDDDHAGQRLDNFLITELKGVPKSRLYRIVRSGEVRVNSRRVTPEYRLIVGDLVRLPPVRTATERPTSVPGAEFPVLYEDDALLAIDKPAGVAVHGGSGVSFGVIEQLRAARPQARFLELVHRIDRETSGVLLVARRRPALLALHEAMRQGQVAKRYLALVQGDWNGPAQALRFPLHRYLTPEGERRVMVRDGGQVAGTRVKALARRMHPRFGPVTLVQADLETGRTHQIRVHLAHVGHRLLGDEKYGDYELNKLLQKEGHKRMFLHAYKVRFKHPSSGQDIHVEAPVPEAFDQFLRACHAPV